MADMPNVPTISREELKAKTDRGDDFVLVEALSRDQFESYHLPGAVNLPNSDVEDRAAEVIPDRDADVVVYCANPDCSASPEAVQKLRDMGYTNVRDYEGGKEEWREAGHEVEETTAATR